VGYRNSERLCCRLEWCGGNGRQDFGRCYRCNSFWNSCTFRSHRDCAIRRNCGWKCDSDAPSIYSRRRCRVESSGSESECDNNRIARIMEGWIGSGDVWSNNRCDSTRKEPWLYELE
jgi:hypothetical protein